MSALPVRDALGRAPEPRPVVRDGSAREMVFICWVLKRNNRTLPLLPSSRTLFGCSPQHTGAWNCPLVLKGQRRANAWGLSGKYLHHQATGFAIGKEFIYHRNGDLESLGNPASFQRWGTDITITLGDRQLRLLSVHLKSGCWSTEQDSDSSAYRTQICTTLRNQIYEVRAWADRREDEGTAFGILGDFNRLAARR